MSKKYDFKQIEKKWQKRWLDDKVFAVDEKSKKPKFYQLETFPYPSAAGLHVGHPKGYIAEDVHARYMRMKGREVLYTIGWDAFGLPTENYAIKIGKSPKEVAKENVKNFKRQVQMFGLSYDWDREINTSDPEYYKWTQWLFIQLFKKGLAYRAKAKVNWCPTDMTVLANEQVIQKEGKNVCERCKTEVVQKDMEQWFLKITDYAERLLSDLRGLPSAATSDAKASNKKAEVGAPGLDWPEATIKRQEDWIGKSEGALLKFGIKNQVSGVKPNFVILHGFQGSPDHAQYKWLKSEIEKVGYKCEVPVLPNPDKPEEDEQVNYVLENVKFDENTVLYGKSLGAVVAMKAVEKLDKKIAGLVLVGGFMGPEGLYKKHNFDSKFDWKFDFEKIKKNAGFVKILSDIKDDVAVKPEQGKILNKNLGGELIEVSALEPHFDADHEPSLVDALLPTIKVFTTRPDTLFGATFLVVSPELAQKWIDGGWKMGAGVKDYIQKSLGKKELDRLAEGEKDKTGVFTGLYAINPGNKEEIPVWAADYVLGSYGTGAIMAVPAHDERDFEFAKKFGLQIKEVVVPYFENKRHPNKDGVAIEKRRHVDCILRNPRTDEYAFLKWNEKWGWTTMIGGGVEEGESLAEAGLRELKEESGYTNIKFVRNIGRCYGGGYAVHKGVNRIADIDCLFFELEGDDKEDVAQEELDKHKVVWLKKNQIESFLNVESSQYLWSVFINSGEVYSGDGVLINSGKFGGMKSEEAKWEITKEVGGEKKIQYKIRDWSVSRQRYWGVPIPMVYCEECGIQPVEGKDLPVLLPDLDDFRPKGKPPLASSEKFIKTKCPKCGGKAERDPETLDTFVDSSWYYLRYTDPKNTKKIFDEKKANRWMPVDLYVIGSEHTVLHLLYSRFVTKFLHDEGLLDFNEPFKKLRHVGLILGSDGQKMSKSRGNVVNPDELIGEFGADSFRVYEMFMGPFEDGQPWDPQGVIGAERFLQRVARLFGEVSGVKYHASSTTDKDFERLVHKTIKKVGEDIEALNFNTAISALMILLNEAEKQDKLPKTFYEIYLKLLHPFAPHLTQEFWEMLGNKGYITYAEWPEYDPKLIKDDKFTLVIQINGRVRDSVEMEAGISQAEAEKLVLVREKVKEQLRGMKPKKIVFVPGRLISIVI